MRTCNNIESKDIDNLAEFRPPNVPRLCASTCKNDILSLAVIWQLEKEWNWNDLEFSQGHWKFGWKLIA